MGRIRRWFSGTFRPDKLETDEIESDKTTTDTLEVESVSGATRYASAHSGANADVRLGNAISAANGGDTIVLENTSYNSVTISKSLKITGSISVNGAAIANGETWTFDTADHSAVEGLNIKGTLVADQFNMTIKDCGGFGNQENITVNQSNVKVLGCTQLNVTYQSGTTKGIVDSSSNVTVTDNGTNTIGDIA